MNLNFTFYTLKIFHNVSIQYIIFFACFSCVADLLYNNLGNNTLCRTQMTIIEPKCLLSFTQSVATCTVVLWLKTQISRFNG